MSAGTVRLPADQLDVLARLIVEHLERSSAVQAPLTTRSLVDAATLAHELGVSRAWVYRNAPALGAVRLPSSPAAVKDRRPGSEERGRLRFDVEAARAATSRLAVKPSHGLDASPGAKSRPHSGSRRRRSPNGSPDPGSILAVRPRAVPR